MKLSIIIPAHNEEKIIEKTLESIPKSAERIVVCNACTDKTEKRAKKYAKILTLEEANVSKARNLGAKESSGDILIFLDADTKFTSNTSEEIKKSLNHGVVGTCKVSPDPPKLRYKFISSFKNIFLKSNWSSGIIFCKKEVFNKINGFNEQKTKKETSDFFSRARQHGEFKIANTYVINSMRRFEKWGIFGNTWFWIRESIKPTKKEYTSIR